VKARHPNGPGRLLRALVDLIRFEPVAALLLAGLFLIAAAVVVTLLRDSGWLPGWLANLPPLRPGLWR
jgi:hypothetical protein